MSKSARTCRLPQLPVEVQYITENGSYMLANGVIVLIDEDIESYINQILVFQKKDNNLATE